MTIILHTARIYRNGDRPPPYGKDGMSLCHAMLMRNDDVIEGWYTMDQKGRESEVKVGRS